MIAIARLMNGAEVIGLRILSYKDEGMKKKVGTDTKDVPLASVKAVILSGGAEIVNLGIVDDKVVGTNGSIDRLAGLVKLGTEFVLPEGAKSPLVVLNKIENVGYTVADYKGQVKRLPNDVVVEYAETQGIANGKVVTKDGSTFISSISGEYDETKIAKSKYGGKAIDMSHLGLSTKKDTSTIAKETGQAVSNSIEYKDAFKTISEKQEAVMKEWYMWYTVRAYEEISHSLRLDIAPSKVANLARFKSDLEWKLAGMWDNKIFGSSHCELGHPLRYEYHAKGYDENGEECGHLIFGETCSSDFFEISKEDMDRLIKIRMQMTYEIDIVTDAFTNGTVEVEWSKCGALKLIIEKMIADKRSREDYVDLFGFEVAVFLSKYMTAGLPFPESLIHMAKKNMLNCERSRAISCIFGNKATWDARSAWLDIEYQKEQPTYSYYRKETFEVVPRFLDWVFGLVIGGAYSYYPVLYETVNDRSQNMKIGKNDEEGKKLAFKLSMGSGQFSKDDREEYWEGVRRFNSAFNLYSDVFSASTIIGAGDQAERVVRYLEYVSYLAAVWIEFKPFREDIERTYEVYKELCAEVTEYCSKNSEYIGISRYNIGKAIDDYISGLRYGSHEKMTIPKSIATFVVSGVEDAPFSTAGLRTYTSPLGKTPKVYEDYIEAMRNICGEQGGEMSMTTEVFEAIAQIKGKLVEKIDDLRTRFDKTKTAKLKYEEERREAERRKREEEEKRLAEEAKARELEEEKKKKAEEDAKAAKDKEDSNSSTETDKMDELKKLLDKWSNLENGYKTAISRDIINRGLAYSELSYKQKRVIDETYEMYKYADENKGELPREDIVQLTDEQAQSYELIYQGIVSSKALKDKVEESSKIALDVFKTVIRTKKMSPKQKKHVDNILEIVKK